VNDTNEIRISGRLGTDPELRFSPSGKPFAEFRLASSRYWTSPDGQKQEETTWFSVRIYGDHAADVATAFHKGDPILVTGRVSLEQWTGKDGTPRATIRITSFDPPQPVEPKTTAATPKPPEETDHEDLPF
jgi:single-strand DNA-binding protein